MTGIWKYLGEEYIWKSVAQGNSEPDLASVYLFIISIMAENSGKKEETF